MDKYWKHVITGIILLVAVPLSGFGLQYGVGLQSWFVTLILIGGWFGSVLIIFFIPWDRLKRQKVNKI